MREQKALRATTLDRHVEAFKDLAAHPGKYSQAEWTYKHHIGNRSATSAIKMGIIERRNGTLHCTRERIHSDMVVRVLNGNAEQRANEKKNYHDGLLPDPRTDEFYNRLPDFFTTGTAAIVATEVGIPKTTMQRIFRKDARFHRVRHGTYCKSTFATKCDITSHFKVGDPNGFLEFHRKPEHIEKVAEAVKDTPTTVTVNIPTRTVSILWGLFKFTI